MPCSLVDIAIHPRNLLSSVARWNTEADGYPGNVDAHLPKYTMSHPGRSIISSYLFLDLKRSLRFTFTFIGRPRSMASALSAKAIDLGRS
jgi:hypothetical protein